MYHFHSPDIMEEVASMKTDLPGMEKIVVIDALKKLAENRGLAVDDETLLDSTEVSDLIQTEVAARLKGTFGGYEIPRNFILLKEDFSLDAGTLTQTMKLKRRVVLQQFEKEVEAAYAKA